MENKLFELARRRRSCRRYTGEKISDEIVDEILKVALLAPSSWGGHPIEFVVVRNGCVLDSYSQSCRSKSFSRRGDSPTAQRAG